MEKDVQSLFNAYDYISKIKEGFKTLNRYNCDPSFDLLIKKIVEEKANIIKVKRGDVLYRARIYNEKNPKKRFKNPPEGDFKGYDEKRFFRLGKL